MAQVFKTSSDSTQSVEILGVGRLGANGQGGVPVERAAQVMAELQELDEYGNPKLSESGATIPLKGSALTTAAKRWAESRGLEVVNLSDDEIFGLPREAGALPELTDAGEQSKIEYERQYGHIKGAINTDQEWLANGGPVPPREDFEKISGVPPVEKPGTPAGVSTPKGAPESESEKPAPRESATRGGKEEK